MPSAGAGVGTSTSRDTGASVAPPTGASVAVVIIGGVTGAAIVGAVGATGAVEGGGVGAGTGAKVCPSARGAGVRSMMIHGASKAFTSQTRSPLTMLSKQQSADPRAPHPEPPVFAWGGGGGPRDAWVVRVGACARWWRAPTVCGCAGANCGRKTCEACGQPRTAGDMRDGSCLTGKSVGG